MMEEHEPLATAMMAEYPAIIEHCISVKFETAHLIYQHALNPPVQKKGKSRKPVQVQEPLPTKAPSD